MLLSAMLLQYCQASVLLNTELASYHAQQTEAGIEPGVELIRNEVMLDRLSDYSLVTLQLW